MKKRKWTVTYQDREHPVRWFAQRGGVAGSSSPRNCEFTKAEAERYVAHLRECCGFDARVEPLPPDQPA